MNGVLERYELKLKQTSKGIWFCDGLTVAEKTPMVLTQVADELMGLVEDVLREHNEVADKNEKEKD